MPASMPEKPDAQRIQEQVDSLSWYHTLELGQGVVTPGIYDHRPFLPFYGLPCRLVGQTALDIGAASGFFTFEMERRGAKVTATDLPEWMAHDFGPHYHFCFPGLGHVTPTADGWQWQPGELEMAA